MGFTITTRNFERTCCARVQVPARLTFLVLSLFVFSTGTPAQPTTTIRGTVTDETTGEPIPATHVSLKNTAFSTDTDHYGRFELRGVPVGMYILEVFHLHYKLRLHVFEVTEEVTPQFAVELQPMPILTSESRATVGSAATSIEGIIVDQESRKPVPLVNVIVKNTRFGAATDSMGKFELRGLQPDLYLIEFRHVAYKTRMHVLQLEEKKPVTMNVEMEQQAIELSEVTVTDRRRDAERLHQTYASTVVTAEQISRTGAATLTDVLKAFEPSIGPGISPRGNRRISNLERVPYLIYLDGTYVQYIAGAMDHIVEVNQIDRIEISRWVGAAPNFGPGTSDRVIQIFTKKPR
ncbi:MAG TPA: carboxypeptidase-like regulatory domain-containing protein [Bacteroidota bacterium]|nr:carboxypeptidase-like regulatory domain-containing protein [Bacteroidota bacterium]